MNIHQSGLIVISPTPSDYKVGSVPSIAYVERVTDGDWRTYAPSKEGQAVLAFDTMSCTSFSALNTIEAQIMYMFQHGEITSRERKFLFDNGYMDANNNVNFSDRFTAIMSGTTKFGNDFVSVWQSIRRDGLLPEKDLPFGGNTFDQYHDKSLITDAMKKKAKIFAEFFTVQYEWVFFDNDPLMSPGALAAMDKAIKQSPLHVGIPLPAIHAVMMDAITDLSNYSIFDTYPPFDEQIPWSEPIHYALKGFISIKEKPVHTFTINLQKGIDHPDVKILQTCLNQDLETMVATTGAGSPGNETTTFGSLTEAAVKRFQSKYGIFPISGYVGAKTEAKLNSMFGSPATPSAPTASKIDAWCDAIQSREGYFAPGENPTYPSGTASWKNNNPGNLRPLPNGNYKIYKRAIGVNNGFCVFHTYEDGRAELHDKLVLVCTKKTPSYSPDMTLLQFYEVYSPKADGNDPLSYAQEVGKRLSVDISTPIKNLL